MDEEELYAGPVGVLLPDSRGSACFLVSRLELAADGVAGVAERVEVEDARGVHDEGRPAEKLVSSPQCLSILHFTFSFTSKME